MTTPTFLPTDPNGYAVDSRRQTFHRRYAEHAKGLPRVRSASELRAYARAGAALMPCADCWPQIAPTSQVDVSTARAKARGAGRQGRSDEPAIPSPPPIDPDLDELAIDEPITDDEDEPA